MPRRSGWAVGENCPAIRKTGLKGIQHAHQSNPPIHSALRPHLRHNSLSREETNWNNIGEVILIVFSPFDIEERPSYVEILIGTGIPKDVVLYVYGPTPLSNAQ